MNDKFQKIKEEGEKIKSEVKEKIIAYIAAAFGLVAGLAWNEAIKALIDHLFPLTKNSVWAKFVYAILMTVIAVIITVNLVLFLKKEENK